VTNIVVDEILSELVSETSSVEIPDEAYRAATRQVIDCIGVTLTATAEPAGRIIGSVVERVGGTQEARVLGTGVSSSMMMSAWGNASLAHLLDFDDTGFSHPTACMLPVALAVGENTKASGRETLAALILGYEVFERLAKSGRGHEPVLRMRGYHPTSIYGTPAAAAVAGRLLGLDAAGIRTAMSLAASSASGLTQPFGTWGKGLNAGNAAQSGILAAVLAQEGYWTDADGLGGEYGLLSAVVGKENYDLSGVPDELGKRWSIVDPGLGIKPYPACTSTLRAVDAVLAIRREAGISAEEIERVVVHVHPDLLHTLRYEKPETGFRGKFSLDYTVAAAALDGELTIESFSQERAGRPEFRAMLDRVELQRHPEWPIAERRNNPVDVELLDGRTISKEVPAELGSRGNPLSWEAVTAKYAACAGRVLLPEQVRSSVGTLTDLVDAPGIVEVIDELTTAAPPVPGHRRGGDVGGGESLREGRQIDLPAG
jgi:2-methylcitrate dehydratase PrpD